MRLIIDTHVLDLCCKPKTAKEYSRKLANRFMHDPHFSVVIPAIVVYELRRGYLFKMIYDKNHGTQTEFKMSLAKLDFLIEKLGYSPLTGEILADAAQLWADARGNHHPNAHVERIDVDVIIAAEAIQKKAHILTPNERHFIKHGIAIAQL